MWKLIPSAVGLVCDLLVLYRRLMTLELFAIGMIQANISTRLLFCCDFYNEHTDTRVSSLYK